MQQYQASTQRQIARYNRWLAKGKALYRRLYPADGRKPKWAVFCAGMLRRLASRPHRKRQDAWFPEVEESLRTGKRAMVFLVPALDVVNGGLMSICHIASRSQGMKEIHSCDVLLVTLPGKTTISAFSKFENDWKVFRFEQLETVLDSLNALFLQVPEVYLLPLLEYLEKHPNTFQSIPDRRLNILNQNIEMMPGVEEIGKLAGYFTSVTQTCAHERYCTPGQRELYGMPLHLLPADIPARFYQIPYGEKENLIAYSNDENPHKEKTLKELARLLPDYRFLMIENMSFDEYRQTISRAKWTLTFGEGWDAYYIQPYFSRSIGFTVFNEAFCPERMRAAPTVFPDYETLPERMARFIREHDQEDLYNTAIEEVRGILFPPPPLDAPAYDALLEFYRGNYTLP